MGLHHRHRPQGRGLKTPLSEQGTISALEAFDELLAEEFVTRERWRVKVELTTAWLTRMKPLESSDFTFEPSHDRNGIFSVAERAAARRGVKGAKVALARKLAVILNRMWIAGTEFQSRPASA